MDDSVAGRPATQWVVIAAAATLLAVTTGIRQSLGLFVRPFAATGLGIATVSLALAVGQLLWGASQPFFGIVADRIGTAHVVVLGGLLLAAGLALAPTLTGAAGLFATIGVLSAIGAGAASFAIMIGAVAKQVPAGRQAFAAGVVSAGASLGQLVFAPLTQAIILVAGSAAALWTLAGVALLSTLLARPATGSEPDVAASEVREPRVPVAGMLRSAFAERSYWYLHAGFFACGFHIAFLITHLPNVVALCGLAPSAAGVALAVIGFVNVCSSIATGWLAGRFRMKALLVALYATRVVAIGGFLAAPKTLLTLYAFAAVLGATWLATVPATAGLVGKLFGPRHLSTLFGFTIFSHQVGAFFGAWIGGVVMARTGSYQWVWYLDMLLATLAAIVSLPIREARPPTLVRAVAAA